MRLKIKTLTEFELPLLVGFGNKQLQEKLKNEFDIDRAFNISDQALAKIFS